MVRCEICPEWVVDGGTVHEECLRAERDRLRAEVERLRAALDRDKTGLAAALAEITAEVKGRRWICQGRGSYTYDDDRYRREAGFAFDAIEKIAVAALSASGKLAHDALRQSTVGCASVNAGGIKCQREASHCGAHFAHGFPGVGDLTWNDERQSTVERPKVNHYGRCGFRVWDNGDMTDCDRELPCSQHGPTGGMLKSSDP